VPFYGHQYRYDGESGTAPWLPEVRCIPPLAGSVRTIILAAFFAILILPQGGYVLVKDQYHKTVPHDLYKLPMTPMQDEQTGVYTSTYPNKFPNHYG